MNIVFSLIFILVVVFDSIEISSASSSPREIDFISQLDKRRNADSHQASSSHSHLTGEGLAETELRLNTNPQAHYAAQIFHKTYMHFHLDPQTPSTKPEIPTQLLAQVPLNSQKIPVTVLNCKKSKFDFIEGFEYWAPESFEQGSNRKLIRRTYKAVPITPGNHQVEMNNFQEAVGFSYDGDHYSYITYQGSKVALRWENGKLGVRFLEPVERTFLNNLAALQRSN